MNPAQRVDLLRTALSEGAGATSEDLHAQLSEDHSELRLGTVKSTLYAFREHFACDDHTGLWHIRYHRHAVT